MFKLGMWRIPNPSYMTELWYN